MERAYKQREAMRKATNSAADFNGKLTKQILDKMVPNVRSKFTRNPPYDYRKHAQKPSSGVFISAINYINADRYEGQCVKDERGAAIPDGKGALLYRNGDLVEGHWTDGFSNGHARATYSDGTVIEGEIRDGSFNGQGEKAVFGGTYYKGEF